MPRKSLNVFWSRPQSRKLMLRSRWPLETCGCAASSIRNAGELSGHEKTRRNNTCRTRHGGPAPTSTYRGLIMIRGGVLHSWNVRCELRNENGSVFVRLATVSGTTIFGVELPDPS